LLQTVDFTEGQAVKRGDLLAQVDPRPQQAALDQAKAQISRDQAQLANLQVNLGRNLPLLAKGFATDQQVIAVGTLITERPPHRSVRAEFPHTAPTSGV